MKKLSATTGVEQFETRVLLSGTPLQLTGGLSADAYIKSNTNDASEENFGSAPTILVDALPKEAALLKFDVSALAPGSTVTSASLTFTVTDPSPGTWEIYQVLKEWKESEVTYDWPTIGGEWQVNGAQGAADRGATVLGTLTATAAGTVTVELNAAGIAVVQSWVNNPANNHGLVIQDYTGSTDSLGFASRENPNAAARPVFTINYTSEITPGNVAPVVNAGPNQTILLGQTLSLDGTVSDDGTPAPGNITTNWGKVTGPGTVTFGNAGAVDTTATFSQAGTYMLRLRADDGELTSIDVIEITVVDATGNTGPVVSAGPDQIAFVNRSINLDGSVHDDGINTTSPYAVTWTKVSGSGSVQFSNANSQWASATFSAAGTYVLQLSATDGFSTITDRVTIAVYDLGDNDAPVVSAGEDQSVLINQTVTLAGLVVDDSTPDPNAVVSALWSLVSGPGNVAFANAAAAGTTATFTAAGTYVLQLRGNDGTLSTTDNVSITVNALPVNQAPVVNAGIDRTVLQTGTLHLDASVTDDGLSGPLTTTWSLVSGPGSVTFGTPATLDATATFSTAGTYVLRLTVNDGQFVRTDDVSVSVVAAGGQSTTVSFQDGISGYAGTQDTYIRAVDEAGNNGNATTVRVDGQPDEAALIKWALTGIAAGSQVNGASITLNITDTSPHTFELYAVKRAWVEGQATWEQAANGQPWAVNGVSGATDRDSIVLGTFTSTTTGAKTFQLNAAAVAVIQSWINNPATNFGFVILDYDNLASDSFGFSSSETTTVSQRPKLTLTLGQAAPTGGINLLPVANQTMSHSQDTLTVNLPTSGASGTPVYAVEFSSANPAQPLAAGDVIGAINGSTLTINPRAGYSGQILVKVHVRDTNSDDVETFSLNVTNGAPVLGTVSDRIIYRDTTNSSVSLPISDIDNDLLTYTIVVDAASDTYKIDQAHGLTASQELINNNYYQNARGLGEKYLQGSDGWYVLLTNGDLYRWGGSIPESTLVASLGVSAYVNPKTIWDAASGPSITASVLGNSLVVTPPGDYFGDFEVIVTANDGIASSSTRTIKFTTNPLSAAQAAALATLELQFPELVARTENDLGVPSFLMNRDGFLTAASSADPIQITKEYLNAHRDLFGLTATDTLEVLVSSSHTSSLSGLTYVYLQQTYNGIQVYGSVVNSGVNAAGQVLVLGNSFAMNVAGSLNTLTPTLTAQQAVQAAAPQLGVQLTEALQVVVAQNGADLSQTLSDGGISTDPISARLMILPIERGESRLVWSLVINMANSADWLNVMVDAQTGAILHITNWTSDASYNVFPLPLGEPDDGPGLPESQQIVTDPADATASPFGWHDVDGQDGDEFTDTRGNNVFAQEDRDGDDAGGARPSGGSGNNYDFDFDPTQSPLVNQNQAIVNLFYWNNIVHDVMAHYGFDEASGNFQSMNYSGQGLGGDQVFADAQDAADLGAANNANFATPPDGFSPRMQMYEFDLTTPFRDSDNDPEVIVHEYGHGVTNRLVGGAADAGALQGIQSGAMGEGWSDYFALVFTATPEDLSSDAYPVGTYVLGQPTDGPGIRRFPYSFDMAINPLTYNDIDPAQIDVPVDFPEGASEVHDAGEVWASALWDMYWLLVDRDGFDADLYTGTGGNNTALNLVIEGLKLTPASPTMLDARDGILAADAALFAGANTDLIWQAFARRGMGVSALDGGDHNSVNVTEAFDTPTGTGGPAVTLTLEGSPFPESGAAPATITATIAEAATSDIRVNLGFSGTAKFGIDYTASANFIVIPAGETSASIELTGLEDTILETPNETVIVEITSVVNGSEQGEQQVTAEILDNDGINVTLTSSGSVQENAVDALITFTATLSATSTEDVVVFVRLVGTASIGFDYEDPRADDEAYVEITITAGELSGSVDVSIIDDDVHEANETIVAQIVSVQNAAPKKGNLEATGVIIDDEDIISLPVPQVSMTITPSIISENGGDYPTSADLSFTLNRQGGVVVELAYSGTAVFGVDYTAPTIVFLGGFDGDLTTTVQITAINDLLIELDESIIVNIIAVYDGVEAGGFQQASTTIASEDVLPGIAGIAVTDPVTGQTLTDSIAENGGTAKVTVSLLQAAVVDSFVPLLFSGSASYTEVSNGVVDFGQSDYTRTDEGFTTQGVLGVRILAGETTGSIVISAVNDPNVDDPTFGVDETVTVTIDSDAIIPAINGVVANPDAVESVTIGISDDDLPGLPNFFEEEEPNNTQPTAQPLGNIVTAESNLSAVYGALSSAGDVDFYSFVLEAGDIISATVFGAGRSLSLFSPTAALLIGSSQDATSNHPISSPLLGGGNAALSYVVSVAGTYAISVTGASSGNYQLQLGVFQPVLEQAPVGTTQILFLDFDGATIEASGFIPSATLSPLSTFLPRWGLTAADENAVIDAIIADVTRVISIDILNNGLNPNFGIQILNSRDHADPWGQDFVSRIVIGGTQAELGISNIYGIAESIDVGNFDTTETAVVLLDVFSNPAEDPNSLNSIPLAPGATLIQLIGTGVGNTTAHEAGHFFSNWHTNADNLVPNIQDSGAGLAKRIGLGEDGIFGSDDDLNVTFVADTYAPAEGFTGTEDTRNSIAFSLTTGTGIVPVEPETPPEVSININNIRIAENGGVATISVILSERLATETTVTLDLTSLDLDSSEYDLSGPLTLVIGVNELSESITLTSKFDNINDGDKVFTVSIASVSAGAFEADGSQSATATIIDDDKPASVQGLVFNDIDGDGLQDSGELGVGGVRVFADLNHDGDWDGGEFETTTNGSGLYTLTDPGLTAGTYDIRQELPDGFRQTTPANDAPNVVELGIGETISNVVFGQVEIVRPEVTLELSKPAISENLGTAVVTARLSEATTVDVTVTLSLAGDALEGSDYTITTTNIVIAAGDTSGTATITGVNNFSIEPTERIFIGIDSVENGDPASGQIKTLFIADDDNPAGPSVSIEDAEPALEGNGNTSFDTDVDPVFYNTGAQPKGVATGDVNGDGHIDLLVLNYMGGSVSILLNNGNGSFAAATNVSVGSAPDSIALGDFDGDGDLDFAVATGSNIAIRRNNGDGTFTSVNGILTSFDPGAVTAGDFDGDGDLDLAFVNTANTDEQSGAVIIAINNGAGVFTQTPAFGTGNKPSDLAAADFDHDGDLDLVVANGGILSSTVTIMENNGSGAFSFIEIAAGARPTEVLLGDFTNDGDIDIAVANIDFNPIGPGNINTVSILEGSGHGSFAPPVAYVAGPSLRSIASGDIDADGDLDIVSTNDGAGDNVVTVLINNGDGFQPFAAMPTGELHTPQGITTADIDHDGDADVISTNRFGGGGVDGVSVFKSTADARKLVFQVLLSEFSDTPIAIDFTTQNGSATAGEDYVPRSGTLYFAPGQLAQTIEITIIGETSAEPDEDIFIVLSNPRNVTIADGTAEGTIVNDDFGTTPLVSLSSSGLEVNENGGSVTLTATLTTAATKDILVELDYLGNAINLDDFIVTSNSAPISVDGNFDDWKLNPNIVFYSDSFGDTHDTDHDGASDIPNPIFHPDVDILEYAVTHDDENFYFYFKAAGEIGRTFDAGLDPAVANANGGRYYIIVTMDTDNDDSTGYPLHQGGYYPTTSGYDMNAEIEYFNGDFNTGHYLNHGAIDDATRTEAFLEQSPDYDDSNPYGSWATQGLDDPNTPEIEGPLEIGYVETGLLGEYHYYTQWVYKENSRPNGLGGLEDGLVFVKDKGPAVTGGIIVGEVSADGHEYEYKVPFKGFLNNQNGDPIAALEKIWDLSFSLEASPYIAPGDTEPLVDTWASDTAAPIDGYEITAAKDRPVTTILIKAGELSGSVVLTGLNNSEVESLSTTIEIVSVSDGADEDGQQEVTISILDDDAAPFAAFSAPQGSGFAALQSSSIEAEQISVSTQSAAPGATPATAPELQTLSLQADRYLPLFVVPPGTELTSTSSTTTGPSAGQIAASTTQTTIQATAPTSGNELLDSTEDDREELLLASSPAASVDDYFTSLSGSSALTPFSFNLGQD